MIYNYRYNYRTLYIDVSRETIKIIYIMIYKGYIVMYTYTYNNILDRYGIQRLYNILYMYFSFLYVGFS